MNVETETCSIQLIRILRIGFVQFFVDLNHRRRVNVRSISPLERTMKCASLPSFNFSFLSVANSFSQSKEKKSFTSPLPLSSLDEAMLDHESTPTTSILLVHGDEYRRIGMHVQEIDRDVVFSVHFNSCYALTFLRLDRVDLQNDQWHRGVVEDAHDRTENHVPAIVAYLSIAEHLHGPLRVGRGTDVVDTFPCSIDAHGFRHTADLNDEKR